MDEKQTQFLAIASRYLDKGLHTDTGWLDKPEWCANEVQLLEFAQAIYEQGHEQGYSEGYSSGYDASYYENSGY